MDNIPSIPQQSSQPPVIPPVYEEKKKSPIGMVIFFILAILTVGVGIYFLGQQSIKKEETTVLPTPTKYAVSTTQPTVDETANWKTYTNNKYNFSIKYPKEWIVKEKPISNSPSSKFEKGMIPFSTELSSPKGKNVTSISINPEGGSDLNINSEMVFTETNLGNKEAKLFTFSPDNGFRFLNLIESRDYPDFSITIIYAQFNEKITKQILSTFKFTQ